VVFAVNELSTGTPPTIRGARRRCRASVLRGERAAQPPERAEILHTGSTRPMIRHPHVERRVQTILPPEPRRR
jgi:hypothetical protein